MKKLWSKVRFIAIQVAILILFFVLLEAGLRLIGYPYGQVGYSHPIYHHDRIPNSRVRFVGPGEFSHEARMNAFGMRDNSRTLHKADGVFRTLVLGDSFAEGFGVDDKHTFCHLSENRLNKDLQGKKIFEVINAGRVSYSPVLEYLYYKTFARQFHADLVVLFLDWSDIQDDYRYEKMAKKDSDGNILAVSALEEKSHKPKGLSSKVALLNYFFWDQPHVFIKRKVIGRLFKYFLGKEGYERFKKRQNPELEFVVQEGNLESDRYMIFREEYFSQLRTHIEFTQSYIKKLSDLVKSDGARFLLVLYPYGVQVDPHEWEEGREFYGFDIGRTYGEAKPFETFELFAKTHGIDVWNLEPYFKESGESPLFYSEDGHWNERGHRLIANLLSERIPKALNQMNRHNNYDTISK